MKRTAQKTINRTAYRSSQKNTGKKSSLFSRIISSRPLNSFGVLIALVCVLAALTIALVTLPTAEASSPATSRNHCADRLFEQMLEIIFQTVEIQREILFKWCDGKSDNAV